jgi:hypothetical protein
MAQDTIRVQAPNGNVYKFHCSSGFRGFRGFVYVYGHRVYGTRSAIEPGSTPGFTPRGKWAFILDAQPSTVAAV